MSFKYAKYFFFIKIGINSINILFAGLHKSFHTQYRVGFKIIVNLTVHLNLTSLKHSISIKVIIMLSTVISPSFFYQTVGNLTLNIISSDSSYFSRLYKYILFRFPICHFLGSSSLLLDPLKTMHKSRIRHFSLH